MENKRGGLPLSFKCFDVFLEDNDDSAVFMGVGNAEEETDSEGSVVFMEETPRLSVLLGLLILLLLWKLSVVSAVDPVTGISPSMFRWCLASSSSAASSNATWGGGGVT